MIQNTHDTNNNEVSTEGSLTIYTVCLALSGAGVEGVGGIVIATQPVVPRTGASRVPPGPEISAF